MTVIAEKDRDTVRAMFGRELVADVELLFFTRSRSPLPEDGSDECQTCDETGELLGELVSLSDRIRLTTCDVDADATTATRYNVTTVPTVLLRRATSSVDTPAESSRPTGQAFGAGPNVRFLGLPAGY